MQIIRSIQNRIYELRGERVILDRDLAVLYETETKVFNQAVKRNINRFPDDFMFQLTKAEYDGLRFQIETLENSDSLRSQIVTSNSRGGVRYIAIMRAFVEIRRIAFRQNDLREQLKEIKVQLGEHDAQLNHIYDAMENLLDEKAAQRKWEDRDGIGFKI
jgi:hypothetical protein